MLVSYGTQDVATTLVGTGAAWLNDDGAATLFDKSPQSVARLRWLSGDGSPAAHSITDYIELRFTWLNGFAPRVAGLFGLTLQAGVKVSWFGRLAGGDGTFTADLGGNSQSQRTVEMPDGSIAACYVFDDDLSSCNGAAVRIYNDLNSVKFADETFDFDIGEALVKPAVDIPVMPGWDWQWVDPTIRKRTLGSQMFEVVRPRYRKQTFQLAPQSDTDYYNSGLSGGMDMLTLAYQLTGDAVAMVVPRWKNSAGALDSTLLHKMAVFGKVTPLQARDLNRTRPGLRYTQMSFDLEEIPS